MEELISVQNLTKCFAASEGAFKRSSVTVRAVDAVSLSIRKGVSLGIVGESGSGKTTLARIIGGMLSPDSGELLYRGEPLRMQTAHFDRYRKNVQMVFQDPYTSLNPKLSIASALSDGITRHITRDKREVRQYLERLMQRVGLESSHLDRHPHQFSGGQRQRISLARALSLQPELILADEPVSSLDVSVQAQILNLMKQLQKEEGVTFLLISHDLAVVSYLCEEIAVMYQGQVVEYGKTADILKNPKNEYTRTLLAARSAVHS